MSSKWNWLIDNPPLRAVINTAGLAVWMVAAVGILEFAARF